MTNKDNNTQCAFRTSIGGQALIEGIMMLGPRKRAIVCRGQDELIEKVEDVTPLKEKSPILGLPLVRGVAGFLSSMINGVKAISFSADQLPEDMQEEPDKIDLWIEKHFSNETAQKLIIGVASGSGNRSFPIAFPVSPHIYRRPVPRDKVGFLLAHTGRGRTQAYNFLSLPYPMFKDEGYEAAVCIPRC